MGVIGTSGLTPRTFLNTGNFSDVMEQGGNNQGPMVTKIIRANGGTYPEPWCGDFCAYCYRLAGSKSVTRGWASVRLVGSLAGVTRTTQPRPGDLVRFTFDHVGMFVKDAGAFIETIEGNTGANQVVRTTYRGREDGDVRRPDYGR